MGEDLLDIVEQPMIEIKVDRYLALKKEYHDSFIAEREKKIVYSNNAILGLLMLALFYVPAIANYSIILAMYSQTITSIIIILLIFYHNFNVKVIEIANNNWIDYIIAHSKKERDE